MKHRGPIVAIDGPVGVGKSSVARELAERLQFLYIDTGAMYRAVTLKAMRSGLDLCHTEELASMANKTELRFVRSEGNLRILCDGEDVSGEIRSPEVSVNTSPVADNVAVRERMVALQRKMGGEGNIVMEGRDIGTVVFPNAEIKIFLDGDPKVRAERRYRESIERGRSATWEETYNALLERDRRDRSRPVGALKETEDSIVVDTTHLNRSEVVDKLYEIVIQYQQNE